MVWEGNSYTTRPHASRHIYLKKKNKGIDIRKDMFDRLSMSTHWYGMINQSTLSTL
jgi:hypothetical protein